MKYHSLTESALRKRELSDWGGTRLPRTPHRDCLGRDFHPTCDRPGMEALVKDAMAACEQFAVRLPWNLARHGPAAGRAGRAKKSW